MLAGERVTDVRPGVTVRTEDWVTPFAVAVMVTLVDVLTLLVWMVKTWELEPVLMVTGVVVIWATEVSLLVTVTEVLAVGLAVR